MATFAGEGQRRHQPVCQAGGLTMAKAKNEVFDRYYAEERRRVGL